MKATTTRSGLAYEGPSIPTNPSPKKVVERETEETTDKEKQISKGSTRGGGGGLKSHSVYHPCSIPEPDVLTTLPKTTPILESDIPKSLPKPNIPYPSRRDNQKSRDKDSNQMEKIFQIFQDLRFDISFANALLLMPRFAPTIKSLLMNKEKLLELAKIPLNENCSVMLLKKLPKKAWRPRQVSYSMKFPRIYDAIMIEIEAFLAIKVPTYNEGYYDSKGDVTYLESLLSDDTTHNLSPEVFFDYEPQQLRNEPENEHLITFSPKSNSSTISSQRISDPNREEIGIFSGPDDSIPPDPMHQWKNNVYDLNEDECFDSGGGEIDVEVDNSFTFVTWIFLPYLTYPEDEPKFSEDFEFVFFPGPTSSFPAFACH
ncbi:hypothetical protein Tco_0337675 [Tanacetum coccineum]